MDNEVKETIEKGVSELKSTIDDTATQVKDLAEEVKVLKEKPAESKGVNIIIPRMHKGYNLSRQMEKGRELYKDQSLADDAVKIMLDIIHGDVVGKEINLKAAANQTEGTDSKGGYLVIDEYENMINKTAREYSVMIPIVKNVSVSQTDTFKVPGQDANVSVAWDAEGTVTNTSATYKQTSIAIKRLSGYVSVSNELLADSAYDIVGDISEQFAYASGQEIDNQILNGTGTPCSGVLTAAAGSSVVLATGLDNFSSVTADDYSLAMTKLAGVDLDQAVFVQGKLAAHYVRTLKDSNNVPIFQAISTSSPNTIYGIDRFVANKITDTSAASTAFAVLGNFKQFYLVNRLGAMTMLVDPYSDSVSYNTRFVFSTRKGLGLGRSDAFVRIMTAS